jgi:hypothetical protein
LLAALIYSCGISSNNCKDSWSIIILVLVGGFVGLRSVVVGLGGVGEIVEVDVDPIVGVGVSVWVRDGNNVSVFVGLRSPWEMEVILGKD